jgi:microcystin degradation protein MlrC
MELFRNLGTEPAEQKPLLVKSTNHFWRLSGRSRRK